MSLVEVKLLLRQTAIEMARSMETKPKFKAFLGLSQEIIKERYQSIITNGNYDKQSVYGNQK